MKNLIGLRFGRLVVLNRNGTKNRNSVWICQCDCGNQKSIRSDLLNNGTTKSCGCLRSDVVRKRVSSHGHTNNPLYKTWMDMIYRCYNKDRKGYQHWGGRGITVCDRWLGDNGFDNFLEDMGERPKGMTLDRYPNNNGNYEPSNCRWATSIEQANNKRKRFSSDDIRKIRSIKIGSIKLAKILGVGQATVFNIRSRRTYADVT